MGIWVKLDTYLTLYLTESLPSHGPWYAVRIQMEIAHAAWMLLVSVEYHDWFRKDP